jgi:hypothetical protein
MYAKTVNVNLKKCSVTFKQELSGYNSDTWDSFFFIERPGRHRVHFHKEEFADILNALMDMQSIINSTQIVDSMTIQIPNQVHDEPEMYLTVTKITDVVRITLLGFLGGKKHYCIHFDKDDDIFSLTAEFLRFLCKTKESFIKICVK